MNPTSSHYLFQARLALRRAERFSNIRILRCHSLAESQMYITLARAAAEG